LRAHGRQDLASDIEQSEDIDVEHRAGRGVGDFLDGAKQPVAGIVQQDIDAAELGESRCYRRGDAGGVRDVDGDDQGVVGVGVELLGQSVGLSRGGDDPVATA
jgi:hypothetical protein